MMPASTLAMVRTVVVTKKKEIRLLLNGGGGGASACCCAFCCDRPESIYFSVREELAPVPDFAQRD